MASQLQRSTPTCFGHVGSVLVSVGATLLFATLANGETVSSYNSWQWNGFSRTAYTASSSSVQSSSLQSSSASSSSATVSSLSTETLPLTAVSDTSIATLDDAVSLSGVVYYDANANGVRETTDWAIADATVSLVSVSSGDTVAYAVTSKKGEYSFTELATDTYTVTLTTPSKMPGDTVVGAVLDADDKVVSVGTNGTPGDSTITGIVLADGESAVDYDFPQLVYPYNLISKRLLLNVSPGVHHTNPPTPVPEPGMLFLLAVAGLALAGFARARKTVG